MKIILLLLLLVPFAVLSYADEPICGAGTEKIEGICQVIKTDRMKTIGDDAPFFGIFVYLDDLFSWIFD